MDQIHGGEGFLGVQKMTKVFFHIHGKSRENNVFSVSRYNKSQESEKCLKGKTMKLP